MDEVVEHTMHTKASNNHTSECRSGDTVYCRYAWLLNITDFHPWPWKFRLCFSCMFMLTFLHSFLARTLGKKQVGSDDLTSILYTHDVSALISSSLTTCMRGRIGHAWRTAWSTETTDDEMCVCARAFVSSLIRHSGLVDLPPWNCNVEELAWSLFHWLF